MLKNMCKLECQIENKTYQFICDNDSPLNHAKDALIKFLQYVGQIEDQVKAQQEAAKAEEKPVEQVPQEVA